MTIQQIQVQLLAALEKLLASYKASIPPTPTATNIYNEAAACLKKHITLNDSVSPELGCAEAVSYVLTNAGMTGLPQAGIAGTASLYQWLLTNNLFAPTTIPVPGDIIISPTGTSSLGSTHGHVGIVAKYGVLSNDSNTGLFLEKYTLTTWAELFHDTEGFPVYYFHAL